MKAIKALVIGMSLLIVIGVAFLVYGLMRSGEQMSRRAAGNVQSPPAVVAPTSAYAVEIEGPSGGRIEQMVAVGDLLALRIGGGTGGDRVVLVDPRRGTVQGRLTLKGAP